MKNNTYIVIKGLLLVIMIIGLSACNDSSEKIETAQNYITKSFEADGLDIFKEELTLYRGEFGSDDFYFTYSKRAKSLTQISEKISDEDLTVEENIAAYISEYGEDEYTKRYQLEINKYNDSIREREELLVFDDLEERIFDIVVTLYESMKNRPSFELHSIKYDYVKSLTSSEESFNGVIISSGENSFGGVGRHSYFFSSTSAFKSSAFTVADEGRMYLMSDEGLAQRMSKSLNMKEVDIEKYLLRLEELK